LNLLITMPLQLLAAGIGIAATLLLAAACSHVSRLAFLRYLGQYSLQIYVADVFGAAAARIVLLKALHVSSLPVHIVAGMAGALALPLFLIWATQLVGFGYLFLIPRKSAKPAQDRLGGPDVGR